jgi:hypothetical protein
MGVALGSIIPSIITAHMMNMNNASIAVHGVSFIRSGIAMPSPG